jgi:toxin ParE1/3/4
VRVRFTPSARQNFLEVLAYIHREDAAAAGRFRGRAERVLRRLERFPDSGRKLPEFPDLPHREVVVPPYRFFYRVHGRTVWVVAVWHGAREVQEPSE